MLFRFPAVLVSACFLGIASASAQQISERQLIGSLDQMAASAPTVDVGLLIEEVNGNVGRGVAALPNWSLLAQLPQFAVDIEFENNSVAIDPVSYRTIGVIADSLHHPLLRHYRFLIVGHTNATGKPAQNLELSLQRANAIKVAMMTTFSVPAHQLEAVGAGQEWPLDGTSPKDAKNRRVQLINLGPAR
jgi:outer membrane protein OmpA-like peptidoglycan-associated protein